MRLLSTRLSDLEDPKVLQALLASPESDFVERKRTADNSTLGKVVSAFANTNGGWLLLGVNDDGSLAGWRPQGRAHMRDWLRDVLDNVLDPLPYFEADVFEPHGAWIGVVRVPRSTASPHFIKTTGEVYERRNGQTRRASTSRVREMMRRGGEGRDDALTRLDDRTAALDVAVALDAPRESTAMHAQAIASIVRVSLVETSDSFRDWVHSREALDGSHEFVRSTARALNDHDWCTPPRPAPARTTVGGHVAGAEWDGRILNKVAIGWDRVGIGGVQLAGERPDDSGIFSMLSHQVRDQWLVTALEYLFSCLNESSAFGLAVLRWNLYGTHGADVTTVRDRNTVAAQGFIPPHYDNMVSIDMDVDVGAASAPDVANDLWQQLERLSGAQHF
jgi:hypothetical protein